MQKEMLPPGEKFCDISSLPPGKNFGDRPCKFVPNRPSGFGLCDWDEEGEPNYEGGMEI